MITLENKYLKLTVNEVGAQWTSLYDKERQEELLYQPDELVWGSQAPLLFPIVGKLKDDRYIHYGQIFEMSSHGFLRRMTLNYEQPKSNEVIFRLESNEDTKKQYPFDFELIVTMTLKKQKVKTKVVINNPSFEPLYFSFGGHPGFKVIQFQPNRLTIEAKKPLESFDNESGLITTSEIINQTDFDLKEVDLNKTLILETVKSGTLHLKDRNIKVSMKPAGIFSVWSPKHKETGELADVVCLEPWWGINDSIYSTQQFKDKKGIIKVKPHESKVLSFTVEIDNFNPYPALPEAVGPYSLSRDHNGTLYLSGMLPINPQTNQIEAQDTYHQLKQILHNIGAVLQSEGLTMDDIIKTTVFMKDLNDFNVVNELYAETFTQPYPARSAVEVSRLPKDVLIEVEVIAVKK